MEKNSIQFWSSIESRLRTEALANPKINICYNTYVETVDQDDDSAWTVTRDGKTFYADILIGADDHRSRVRRHIAPKNPDAIYAGYIVWVIDTINEDELPDTYQPSQYDTGVTMLEGINGFLFGSIIDGGDSSANREIGCAWYDNSRTDLLRRLGCVKGNVIIHLKELISLKKRLTNLPNRLRKDGQSPG